MEKYTIEIESSAGWIMYHSIMRPGEAKGLEVLGELQSQFPDSKFRLIKWTGDIIKV